MEEREGIYYIIGSDTPYTGKSFALYPNGQKEAEGNYKDGKLEGTIVFWHENGQKDGEVNYKDGKWDGYLRTGTRTERSRLRETTRTEEWVMIF